MRKLPVFVALAAMFPMMVLADSLVLRNGSRQVGRFISGSSNQVVFEDSSGGRHTYNTNDIQSIDFGSDNSMGYNQPARSGRYNTDNSGTVSNANVNWNEARSIPSGTSIVVRNSEAIDSTNATEGRTYPASVAQDITDNNGNVIVPRGSDAELVVNQVRSGGTTGSPDLVLDLQSLNVNGRRYLVSTNPVTQGNQQGIGKNKRTAEMVGGGGLLGTVIGAIAGGGKGAAIGAITGAAAGAGAQVLTRGKEVKVPVETQLTFQLTEPVSLVPVRR